MFNEFSRSERLLGKGSLDILGKATVAVFGIGGVGSYAAEALARSGIGSIILVDNDVVSITNINRQIIALHSTLGKKKTSVMKERISDINPQASVETRDCFFDENTAGQFNFSKYDYVIDAIDTVKSKILLAKMCAEADVKIISSMGTGNKLDSSRFEISDIYKTEVCPLARVMRKELKAIGIKKLKVLYSKEEPVKVECDDNDLKNNRPAPASVSFVPSVAGLMIAGEVVKDLITDSTKNC